MYVPAAHQRAHVPDSLTPIALGFLAVTATLLAWAALTARPTTDETSYIPLDAPGRADIRSVAYTVPLTTPGGTFDQVYVRDAAGTGAARLLASFPSVYNLHARGSASPLGDLVAVLHVASPGGPARLTLVELASGELREVEGAFDYLSAVAWSPDGSRLAAVRAGDGGQRPAVLEVSALTGVAAEVASFEGAPQVVPVGYSIDGERLYVVSVDQSGSWLWVVQGGKNERTAFLSPGRTRDWTLSSDGARLAFVDLIGVGERTYAGRTLIIATGAVSDAASAGDQLGAAWRPGSGVADFGGPGGTLRLSEQDPGAYVIPLRWAPDGSTLVATMYAAGRDGEGATESIELLSTEGRVRLSHTPGAQFLGWVRTSH